MVLRRLPLSLVSVVFVLGILAPAQAADLQVKKTKTRVKTIESQVKNEKTSEAPFVWSGWYSGAHLGGVRFSGAYDVSTVGPETTDANGLDAGLMLGYMTEVSKNWVMGAEADLGRSTASSSYVSGGPGRLNTSLNWNGHLRGRLGYAMGQTLFFVAGGGAMAIFEQNAPNYFSGMVVTNTVRGYSGGIGIDHAFNANLIGRVEYIYDRYGEKLYQYNGTNTIDSHYSSSTVRAALIWKF